MQFTTIKINLKVLITRQQFSENYHGGPKGGFQSLFFKNKLVLTIGVNHQYLVVGENDATRVYLIP